MPASIFSETDSDDEMVTFSSDEELVEALGSFAGDVFRVHVRVGKDEEPASDEPQGMTQQFHALFVNRRALWCSIENIRWQFMDQKWKDRCLASFFSLQDESLLFLLFV